MTTTKRVTWAVLASLLFVGGCVTEDRACRAVLTRAADAADSLQVIREVPGCRFYIGDARR